MPVPGGDEEDEALRSITVQYEDMSMKPFIKTFTGFSAQIIQHEIDHCDGVLI